MTHVMGYIAKILFYVFVIAVVCWTASLTIGMVQKVLPNDPITPYFALALFDGGALAWLMTFLFYGKGLAQRGAALLMVILDLIGVVMMSAGEIMMSGQTFTAVPQNLGTIVVYGVGGYTALNLIAAYFFHIMEPSNIQRIETQTAQDRIVSKALQLHADSLNDISAQVAGRLSDRSVRDALISLGINPDGYVDGKFRDVGSAPLAPARLEAPAVTRQPITRPPAVTVEPVQTSQPADVKPVNVDPPDSLRWPVENHHTQEKPAGGGLDPEVNPFVVIPNLKSNGRGG